MIIYSERPLAARAIRQIVSDSDARVRASAIYRPADGTRIFLTTGGWRWQLLALTSQDAFALSLPINDAIVINDSDASRNLVRNGAARFGVRSLDAIIAHERAHRLIRQHFGRLADVRYPEWLREGYCDFIAGESTLNDAEAEALIRAGKTHPALVYYLGRKRVEWELESESVDQLFERHKGLLHRPPHSRLIPDHASTGPARASIPAL